MFLIFWVIAVYINFLVKRRVFIVRNFTLIIESRVTKQRGVLILPNITLTIESRGFQTNMHLRTKPRHPQNMNNLARKKSDHNVKREGNAASGARNTLRKDNFTRRVIKTIATIKHASMPDIYVCTI